MFYCNSFRIYVKFLKSCQNCHIFVHFFMTKDERKFIIFGILSFCFFFHFKKGKNTTQTQKVNCVVFVECIVNK